MSDERQPGSGPVPVRDLMRRMTAAPEAEGEPAWEGEERSFELDGTTWTVRAAGAGSYGTGMVGAARLVALHFFRDDAPERPVREALVPRGAFPGLRAEELVGILQRATPIELAD